MSESNDPVPQASDRRKERLVVLALVGVLALNYPLLELFNDARLVLGVPVLYLYLFLVWGGLIGLSAWALEGSGRPKERETPQLRAPQRD